jgi:predicted RNase H-like HicB family nuclease
MQVIALIHEEDGAFGVSFPDFPGCTTVGNSLDNAAAKATDVIAFHADSMVSDGITLPRIRTLSELSEDKDFIEDSYNAVVIAVSYQPPGRAVRINMTIDESLLDRIDQAAKRVGETRSSYFASAAAKRMSEELKH